MIDIKYGLAWNCVRSQPSYMTLFDNQQHNVNTKKSNVIVLFMIYETQDAHELTAGYNSHLQGCTVIAQKCANPMTVTTLPIKSNKRESTLL